MKIDFNLDRVFSSPPLPICLFISFLLADDSAERKSLWGDMVITGIVFHENKALLCIGSFSVNCIQVYCFGKLRGRVVEKGANVLNWNFILGRNKG